MSKCGICGAETDNYYFTGEIAWSFGHDKKVIRCRWCSPNYSIRVEEKK